MTFILTLDHLIASNLKALEARTLQAQNPIRYDEHAIFNNYYLTPDGKFTCGIGCALPKAIRIKLREFDVLDGFGSDYDTDYPQAVLWRLKTLHNAWLNHRSIRAMGGEMRAILTAVFGYSPDDYVDEHVYRRFILGLAAADLSDATDLYWVCTSEFGWMAWSSDLDDRHMYSKAIRRGYGRFWRITRPFLALRSAIGLPPRIA